MPLPNLINKVLGNDFCCYATNQKISRWWYYSDINLRVYYSKEIVIKEVTKYMKDIGIEEIMGIHPFKHCTIKELKKLRKRFLLIEHNNCFKEA